MRRLVAAQEERPAVRALAAELLEALKGEVVSCSRMLSSQRDALEGMRTVVASTDSLTHSLLSHRGGSPFEGAGHEGSPGGDAAGASRVMRMPDSVKSMRCSEPSSKFTVARCSSSASPTVPS